MRDPSPPATPPTSPGHYPWYYKLMDRDLLPDILIRFVIRHLLGKRLDRENTGDPAAQQEALNRLIHQLRESPIALETDEANNQHYKVPAEFFRLVLGPRLKYSSAYWPAGVRTLEKAEEAMLELTVERAGVEDGQRILDLGCGWGALSLYLAESRPATRVTAVSNSANQKAHIDEQAAARGLGNLEVIVADVNEFDTDAHFDRVISVEMFEHVRNYDRLLKRIAGWLRPDGLLFVHIFAHSHLAYTFEDVGLGDWMARHFFTGGLMPSDQLLLYFQDHLRVTGHWRLGGLHYRKTLEAWLQRMDRHRHEVITLFQDAYGVDRALSRWVRWRVFFMACSELFGYRGGREWIVSHYLFRK